MSGFGLSPSDVLKLIEISTRVYGAFKDAYNNSESQVEGLVREFTHFHHCLVQLDELMKEYGKPLPFPYLDFEETLTKCQKVIKPYVDNLVDRKKSLKKAYYIIAYIDKEKDIDRLRKQITGHYQALNMCISFLQLRLHLEANKQTQRLLDQVPSRTLSIGGQMYSSRALSWNAEPTDNQSPGLSEQDILYRDWLIFNRWLKSENERIVKESQPRPLSHGESRTSSSSVEEETAAIIFRLRREVQDALTVAENTAQRVAGEKRTHLAPGNAAEMAQFRQQVQNMPQPRRALTRDSACSVSSNSADTMAGSMVTIRPARTSPNSGPIIDRWDYFGLVDWDGLPMDRSNNQAPSIADTIYSASSGWSASSRLSYAGISTAETTPEDWPSRSPMSATSLASFGLEPAAFEWKVLCVKVQVECRRGPEAHGKTSHATCSIKWRYRPDHGISFRATRLKTNEVFVTQHFPAFRSPIPLSTHFPPDVSIEFPQNSFGKLEPKSVTNINYIFQTEADSKAFQTLLYTNNGEDEAELLFDRNINTINSSKHKPECRGKSLRLWNRGGVLTLLFYTSALEERNPRIEAEDSTAYAHWVEEPHTAFEWLKDKSYDKKYLERPLRLIFSTDPDKYKKDKRFGSFGFGSKKGEKGSSRFEGLDKEAGAGLDLHRTSTVSSLDSSVLSVRAERSGFGGTRRRLNRFGYDYLEINFQTRRDRKDFLEIWKKYVKPLGHVEGP